MKFSILTFFLTFAACVYAVAIALPECLEREAIRAIQSGDIVPVEHPDGRQELQVYENGVLQGTVVVTQEGEGSSRVPRYVNPANRSFSRSRLRCGWKRDFRR
jgi:hypothetical protein